MHTPAYHEVTRPAWALKTTDLVPEHGRVRRVSEFHPVGLVCILYASGDAEFRNYDEPLKVFVPVQKEAQK